MELAAEPPWVGLKDEDLLAVRICDLQVGIEGSELEARIRQFYDELAAPGVCVRPACHLGDASFSPDCAAPRRTRGAVRGVAAGREAWMRGPRCGGGGRALGLPPAAAAASPRRRSCARRWPIIMRPDGSSTRATFRTSMTRTCAPSFETASRGASRRRGSCESIAAL